VEISGRQRQPLHRLVTFVDAIVAIAITLLVLPLVDAAVEVDPRQVPLGTFLDEHLATVGGFLLSFIVILRLWHAHHDLFAQLDGVDQPLQRLTFLWVLTIVVTPFTTQLIIAYGSRPLAEVLYIGVLLISSLCQTATALWMGRHPELLRTDVGGHPLHRTRTGVMSTLFAVALVLALLLPGLNYWALLILLLAGPASALVRRRAVRP
jgi:uncharacterized membrane protein